LLPQAKAAKQLNVSRRAVQRAYEVRTSGVRELQQAVDAGEISVTAGVEIARQPEDEQKETVMRAKADRAKRGGQKSYGS
jgi:hypothetical protein